VPAGPSRKAAGWPCNWRFRDGNCSLTHVMSRGLLPVSCSTGELIDDVPGGEVALFASSVVSHKGGVMRIGRGVPRSGDDCLLGRSCQGYKSGPSKIWKPQGLKSLCENCRKALPAADPWDFQHLRFFGHPHRMSSE